jgi:hypothetical protein
MGRDFKREIESVNTKRQFGVQGHAAAIAARAMLAHSTQSSLFPHDKISLFPSAILSPLGVPFMLRFSLTTFSAALLLAISASSISAAPVTVLMNDQVYTLDSAKSENNTLWVTAEDLKKFSGFEIKPEGACLDEICIPLTPEMTRTEGDVKLYNATELARKLQQSFVESIDQTWAFGPVPQKITTYLKSALAPDFAIADRNGKVVRLSDFKGKKVLILTWASW